jgi:serine/threonine protein kinase
MPVPSPKNIPIGVPGKVVPYKRPKGTMEWDSEEEEEEDEVAKRDIRKDKVSLLDFEPLKVIGNGCFGKVMMVKFNKNGQIYAMKSIRKAHVVKNNKVRHTLAERNIMQKITHPFVMKLHYAFQNNGKLYMVMDYLNGGDIFYHLSISRRFPEERARFYAAEVLMALECLHEHGFIYRDLKPENVLTDSDGHIRLTDFGLSKEHFEEGQAMTTFVGTTEYLAPEVLKQKGYGKEVDWWSLGVLIFEMLTGCPPFYSKNRQMTFRMILSAELNIPEWISTPAKSMMKDLLVREPSQRLGHGNIYTTHTLSRTHTLTLSLSHTHSLSLSLSISLSLSLFHTRTHTHRNLRLYTHTHPKKKKHSHTHTHTHTPEPTSLVVREPLQLLSSDTS